MGLHEDCQTDIVEPVLRMARGDTYGIKANHEIKSGVYWGVCGSESPNTLARVYIHVLDIEHVREPSTPLPETTTLQPIVEELSRSLQAVASESNVIDSDIPVSLQRQECENETGVFYHCDLTVVDDSQTSVLSDTAPEDKGT